MELNRFTLVADRITSKTVEDSYLSVVFNVTLSLLLVCYIIVKRKSEAKQRACPENIIGFIHISRLPYAAYQCL